MYACRFGMHLKKCLKTVKIILNINKTKKTLICILSMCFFLTRIILKRKIIIVRMIILNLI